MKDPIASTNSWPLLVTVIGRAVPLPDGTVQVISFGDMMVTVPGLPPIAHETLGKNTPVVVRMIVVFSWPTVMSGTGASIAESLG